MTGQNAAALTGKLEAMSGTLSRLTKLSRDKYQNPYAALSWPESASPEAGLFFTPELSSLFQTRIAPSRTTKAYGGSRSTRPPTSSA
jgi:hypothetical protein